MLVVHVLGVLLSLVLGLFAVKLVHTWQSQYCSWQARICGVHTLGLGELVNLGTGEASKELLGKLVRDGLA